MGADPAYYQLPDTTDKTVGRMVVGLCAFFVALVAVVVLVFYNAQSIAQHIPFSAEKRFVRPYEKLISKVFADLSEDSEVADYLQRLADSLKDSMNISDDIELNVHFVDVEEVNAFATLGGHIIIFGGLVNAMPDENSLAMVLAHEIAHVANRDPIAAVSRGLALQMIAAFITGSSTTTGDAFELVGGTGMAMFSRDQERQADIIALRALNSHYGHVGGYRTFFEKARDGAFDLSSEIDKELEPGDEAKSDSGQENTLFADTLAGWLASHPETVERIELLDAEREIMQAGVGENTVMSSEVENYLNSD